MRFWKFWKSKKSAPKVSKKEFQDAAVQTDPPITTLAVGSNTIVSPTTQAQQPRQEPQSRPRHLKKKLLRVVYVQIKEISGKFFCKTFMKTYRVVKRSRHKNGQTVAKQ